MSANVAYGQVNHPSEASALAAPEVYEEFNTLADGSECQSSFGDQLAPVLYASADETLADRKSQPPKDDGQYI